MEEFDFDKFEKHIPEFTARLKEQLQTRMFSPIAPDFEVEVNIYTRGRGYGKQISVTTSDLAGHMNFKMFADVRFHNFGGSAMKDGPLYWLPIDWSWRHTDGGSNGTRAFCLYVNDSGEIDKVRD